MYVPLIFVAHHDLVRYMLPIFPLSLLIGFHRLIGDREFKLAMVLIVPAYLHVYLERCPDEPAPVDAMQQLMAGLG